MALFGEFSHTCPKRITLSSEWCNISQTVEYDSQIKTALGQFQDEARALCPIRTGNLVSSISGEASGDGFTAEAMADYAEYVEYGTWKMSAQPYFVEPFQTAGESCAEAIQKHLQEALTEAQAMAMLEIEERYTIEVEMAVEQANIMAMTGDALGAEMWLMIRLQELQIMRMVCIAQIEGQIKEYKSQGTFEISIA